MQYLNVEVNMTAGLVVAQDQSGLSSSCLTCDLLAMYHGIWFVLCTLLKIH